MTHNAGVLKVRLVSHKLQSVKDKNDNRCISDVSDVSYTYCYCFFFGSINRYIKKNNHKLIKCMQLILNFDHIVPHYHIKIGLLLSEMSDLNQ